MDGCLLCLERNKDILDIIQINSLQWKILDIKNKLEKYFWPLKTMQPKSWICLQCWQKIDDFHNFYEYVEKAHKNLEEITKLSMETIEEEPTLNEWKCIGLEIVLMETLQNEKNEFIEENEESNSNNNSEINNENIEESNSFNETKLRDSEMGKSQNQKVIEFPSDDNDDHYNEDVNTRKQQHKIKLMSNRSIKGKDQFIAKEYEDIKCDIYEVPKENNINNNFEINKENIEEINSLKETKLHDSEVGKSQNKKVIEFSSDDNDDSSTDHNNEDVNIRKQQQKRNRLPNRSIKGMDQFIAKEYGQIKCDICEVPLEKFANVYKHYKEVHKCKGYIKCCMKKFQTRGVLVDHLNLHLNPDYFKCMECGVVLTSRNNLKIHKLRQHKPEDVEFEHKCEDCGKTFPMNFMLRKHKLSHIGVEGAFPCKKCGRIYRAEHLLKRHFDVVHLKRGAKICAVCGKTVDTSNELTAHMTQHEPQTPVNCDVCGKRFINRRNYLIHRRILHSEGGKQEHQCHLCNKICPNHRALLRHINMSHKKGYDHKCSVCGKAFKLKLYLKEHMTTHTGDVLYRCDTCPKTYNSRANFYKHRKKDHPKEYSEYIHKRLYGNDTKT